MNSIGTITLSIQASHPISVGQAFRHTGFRHVTTYPARIQQGEHIEAGGSGGTLLLPASHGLRRGAQLEVRNVASGSLSVTTFDGTTINDTESIQMNTPFESRIFFWTGAGWGNR